MLPPIEMLAKKNRLPFRAWLGLLLAFVLAGCTPAGPRALLNGKKLLETGDYAGALQALRTATRLLPASATAWNYLGVAYQKCQSPNNAEVCYQRALALNRDLVEAHWNLGMAYLEQGKNDPALTEFTQYTLRRNNAPEGWLKMGSAQLRQGQIVAAERSFGAVLTLEAGNAEALNGLGLARMERNRPRDAVQFFEAALAAHPGYAPATLNLAITEQQYFRDNRVALRYYQSYLRLSPRPDNWEQVNALAGSLEQEMNVAYAPPAPVPQPQPVAPTESQPQPVSQPQPQVPPPAQPQPQPQPQPLPQNPAPAPAVVEVRRPAPVVVRPPLVTRPALVVRTNSPLVATHPAPVPNLPVPNLPVPRPQPTSPPLARVAVVPPKPVVMEQPPAPRPVVTETRPRPVPVEPAPAPAAPAPVVVRAPVTYPRYGYLAPARPVTGDHAAAAGAFTRAQVFEQAGQPVEAMQAYRAAAEFDPAWFEAQYNFAVLSYNLGNHQQALHAYEVALAIQPESVDARYNFALALKAAGYVPDAVNELKKVLARHPGEVRAHLALANLYAQKLRDPNSAREQFLKVLELDPHNPQAGNIRNWLAVNGN